MPAMQARSQNGTLIITRHKSTNNQGHHQPQTLNRLVMLDSSLPLDIWSNIVGFLEKAADLSSSLATNKEIHSTLDQDFIYEQSAKRRFPLHSTGTRYLSH